MQHFMARPKFEHWLLVALDSLTPPALMLQGVSVLGSFAVPVVLALVGRASGCIRRN